MRSILAFLTIIGLGAPAGMILCGWCLVTGDIMPCYMVACAIVRVGLWVAGVRVVVEGLETVPAHTACIFMANHVSNLDPPVLIPVLPGRTAVFLKRSLMKIPVLGYAMRLANFIPVDRAGSVQTAQENVRLARKVIEAGIHITTFVEGTRSKDGRLLPFKKGPFYLAMECGVPVVPVTIVGTHELMPKGRFAIKPGTATVIFHPPIEPENFGSRERLMEKVRAVIESGLPEELRQRELTTKDMKAHEGNANT